jgi:hypothetical protein
VRRGESSLTGNVNNHNQPLFFQVFKVEWFAPDVIYFDRIEVVVLDGVVDVLLTFLPDATVEAPTYAAHQTTAHDIIVNQSKSYRGNIKLLD